jgi:hypothetical protein
MNLFNKNVEAYKLDLKDVMSENQSATYYMAFGDNGGVNFLIRTPIVTSELNFTRDQAKSLVEQFQFYIGEDDE